eukprot:GFKZ01014061.1.p2 GENE.GFKZ01014061.1~~GFKZ01014061.1.p2  ORF type:complete len:105 (+),score=1.36 GFKZ01014061.1:113-427(+)
MSESQLRFRPPPARPITLPFIPPSQRSTPIAAGPVYPPTSKNRYLRHHHSEHVCKTRALVPCMTVGGGRAASDGDVACFLPSREAAVVFHCFRTEVTRGYAISK